jgi:hypothetical protein
MDATTNTIEPLGTHPWGEYNLDMDALPQKVKVSFILRTFAHKMSNEVSAAVLKIREKDGKTADEYDAEYADVTKAKQDEMFDKIMKGEVGLRVGGPRGDTIENIALELAAKQAEATLSPKGYWPKADRKRGIKAEDATVEFHGRVMTREEITEVYFAKYKEKFLEEAKAVHAERMEKAKLAKQNAVKSVSTVAESLDDLI